MSELSEQKKIILPYLQRADEINGLNPKVAYYCRLYAIEQGLQIPDSERHKDIQNVLELLMAKLEQDRPLIGISDEDAAICEAFAMRVFKRADKQDRDGKADETTVRAFYAASIFMDVLGHFGETPADMVERKQYAFWKAADIRKALREGRRPDPGPPVKDDLDLDLPDIPGVPVSLASQGSAAPDTPLPGSDTQAQPSNGQHISPPLSGCNENAPSTSHPPQPPLDTISQRQRFRPGSKVYYRNGEGPPVKGTVVTVLANEQGSMYRVGLSARVVDLPEADLAHDFSPGQKVLLRGNGATAAPQEATVVRYDANKWPVLYFLELEDGSFLPTEEKNISAAEQTLPRAVAPSGPVNDARPPTGPPASDVEPPTLPPSDLASTSAAPLAGSVSADDESAEGSEIDELPPEVLPRDSHSVDPGEGYPTGGATSAAQDPRGSPGMSHTPSRSSSPDAAKRVDAPGTGQAGPSGFPSIDYDGGNAPAQSFQTRDSGTSAPGAVAAGSPPSSYPDLPPPTFHGFHAPSQSGAPPPPVAPVPQPPPQLPQRQVPSDVATLPQPTPGYHPSLGAITEAQKCAKYAVSSLSFEDLPTAIMNLQKALKLLTVPGASH